MITGYITACFYLLWKCKPLQVPRIYAGAHGRYNPPMRACVFALRRGACDGLQTDVVEEVDIMEPIWKN